MRKKIHGECKSPEYAVWEAMIQRCHNPKNTAYPKYGAVGITVCWKWRNQFIDFLEDMGRKPSPTHSLDRIDNTKGYYKENCRWVTIHEQLRNRRNTKWLTIDGRTMTLNDWCAFYSIHRDTVCGRISRGYEPLRALTEPLHHTKHSPSKTIFLTHNGETLNLSQWSRYTGINYETLRRRIKLRGWSTEKALTEPVINKKHR